MNDGPVVTPLCVYCWPVITVAVCEHNGHPCCGDWKCMRADKPELPSYMLKPRHVSLFDELP